MKYISIFTLILLMLGCQNSNECLKNYLTFEDFKESPSIAIQSTSSEQNCLYNIKLSWCFGNNQYFTDGKLYLRDSVFYISCLEPSSNDVGVFNMRMSIDEQSIAEFRINNEGFFFNILLKDKLLWNNEAVYVYQVHESFCIDNEKFNNVFFVTKKSGIIGSYYTRENIIVLPKGNILKEQIDYSGFSFSVFM